MVSCNVIILHQHLSLMKCDNTRLTTEMYKELNLHFQHVGGHVNTLNMEYFREHTQPELASVATTRAGVRRWYVTANQLTRR